MARNRKPPSKSVRSDSPPSESAKEQLISGYKGGPQAKRPRGIGKQPPQTSNRRAKAHEPPPEVRSHFDPEEDPNMQGPPHRPEWLKRSPSLQGLAGRPHARGARAEDAEEEEQRGPPRSTHTRHGRQKVPGKRPH